MSSQEKLGLTLEYPVAVSQGTSVQCGWQKSWGLSQGNVSGAMLLFPKEVLIPQLLSR